MKPRSDSVLHNLSIEDQEKVKEWLASLSYADVIKRIAAPRPDGMNINVHENSLRRYYEQVMPDFLAERRRIALHGARRIQTAINEEPGGFAAPTLDALEQRVFEMALNSSTNPEAIYKLYRLILRANDQKFAREKFEFSAAKAILKNFHKIAEVVPKGPIDPRDERRILDQIRLRTFGCLTDAEEPLTGENPNLRSSQREAAQIKLPAEESERESYVNQNILTSTATQNSRSSQGDAALILSSNDDATPASIEDQSVVTSAATPLVQSNPNHSLLKLTAPNKKPKYTRQNPREDGWYPPISLEEFEQKYPGQPYDPYPESTVGNAVIMQPEKPLQVAQRGTEPIRLSPPDPLDVIRNHPIFQEEIKEPFKLDDNFWSLREQPAELGSFFHITNDKLEVPFPWREYSYDPETRMYSVRKVTR